MWTVVYIAHSCQLASMLEEILLKEGILVRPKNLTFAFKDSLPESKANCAVEISVPESDAEEAILIVNSVLAKCKKPLLSEKK